MMNIINLIKEAKAASRMADNYVDGYIAVEKEGTAYGRIGEVYFKDIPVIEAEIAAVLGKEGKEYIYGSNVYDFAFHSGERVEIVDEEGF